MILNDLLKTYGIENISLVSTGSRIGLQICFNNIGNYYILFSETLRDEDLFYSSDFVRQKFILNLQNVVIIKHEHSNSYSIRISRR